MSKLLFTIGNLHTGIVYGVEAIRPFDTIEIHGPFNTENTANSYAHRLAETDREFDRIQVIEINCKAHDELRGLVSDETTESGYAYKV